MKKKKEKNKNKICDWFCVFKKTVILKLKEGGHGGGGGGECLFKLQLVGVLFWSPQKIMFSHYSFSQQQYFS